MKLGVLSDSHDNVPNIERAVALFQAEAVELVIHAGDFVAPFAVAPLAQLECPLIAVFGNNDGERVGLARRFTDLGAPVEPKMATAELDGVRIAVVHEPEPVDALAASGLFDLVIYGHTHAVDIRNGPCMVLNPGETGGWTTGRATVAIVSGTGGALAVDLREL